MADFGFTALSQFLMIPAYDVKRCEIPSLSEVLTIPGIRPCVLADANLHGNRSKMLHTAVPPLIPGRAIPVFAP